MRESARMEPTLEPAYPVAVCHWDTTVYYMALLGGIGHAQVGVGWLRWTSAADAWAGRNASPGRRMKARIRSETARAGIKRDVVVCDLRASGITSRRRTRRGGASSRL